MNYNIASYLSSGKMWTKKKPVNTMRIKDIKPYT